MAIHVHLPSSSSASTPGASAEARLPSFLPSSPGHDMFAVRKLPTCTACYLTIWLLSVIWLCWCHLGRTWSRGAKYPCWPLGYTDTEGSKGKLLLSVWPFWPLDTWQLDTGNLLPGWCDSYCLEGEIKLHCVAMRPSWHFTYSCFILLFKSPFVAFLCYPVRIT